MAFRALLFFPPPSAIADATKRFELIHKEIEKFHSEVEGCRALRAQVSGDDVKFFEVLMNQLESQYDELMVSCYSILPLFTGCGIKPALILLGF